MKHLKKGRKFGRPSGQRKALMKSVVSALIEHGTITTTLAKAKEYAPVAEKAITKAKKADLHSRRVLARVFSPEIVEKLINDIAPTFKERNGGYTRIIKLGVRKSDASKMALLELVK